jgi:hypothetical protein
MFSLCYTRLFQNFSFWNSFLEFDRKTGPLAGFPRACSVEPKVRTNRVLEQAHLSKHLCRGMIDRVCRSFYGLPVFPAAPTSVELILPKKAIELFRNFSFRTTTAKNGFIEQPAGPMGTH